ncbi:MAG: UPF0262 family protein [Myxococcales bacterium]|nr:UPF0262 family protein [Myxococcales bacterium]
MSTLDVAIDEETWAAASPDRQTEWDAAIRELTDPTTLVIRPDVRKILVGLTEQRVELDVRGEGDAALATITIPHDLLAAPIREYVDIVRQLARTDQAGGGLARIEALDMAKKVTHDRGGRAVKRACRELELDMKTARRLFTLVLSLRVDTTRLHGIHGHRRVR